MHAVRNKSGARMGIFPHDQRGAASSSVGHFDIKWLVGLIGLDNSLSVSYASVHSTCALMRGRTLGSTPKSRLNHRISLDRVEDDRAALSTPPLAMRSRRPKLEI